MTKMRIGKVTVGSVIDGKEMQMMLDMEVLQIYPWRRSRRTRVETLNPKG